MGNGALAFGPKLPRPSSTLPFLRFDQGDTGASGSVIVGWDWQIGATSVFGIFADYDFCGVSTDLNGIDGLLTASLEHNNSWAIGARLGWLSGPSTLWYFTGGYTQAQFDARVAFDSATLLSHDRTFNGYLLGGGIDNRLGASNWFLRLEYRFAQFDSESRPLTELATLDVEPSVHSARLLLTYKLGVGGWAGWGMR